MFELKYASEFIEARRLLSKVLEPIAPTTAEAIGDLQIQLIEEEYLAVKGLVVLLSKIYGEE